MGQLLYGNAIHTVKQAQIDANRITQKSGNELRGAQTALQQFSASLSTTRQLDAAGSQINDIAGNVARLHEASLHGHMQNRIAAAEQMGTVAAMAGAAGVAGGSVDTLNETLRLHTEMKDQAMTAQADAQSWSQHEQAGNALKGAVSALDNNVYRAGLDYKQYVDDHAPSLFGRILTVAGAAAATYFAGPKAGAAVLSMGESMMSASNGDYGAASASAMGAFTSAMSAGKDYQSTHGVKTPAAPAGGDISVNKSTLPKFGSSKPFFNFDTGLGSVNLK